MQRRALTLAGTLVATAAATLAALPLAALAQDKPPMKILVGFPPGGSADIVARLLADKLRVSLGQSVGIEITQVAYKGGAPLVNDLLGGQVPLSVDTPLETIEHHRAGKMRIVAVTGEARLKALPEVPTLKEQGINMSADAYFGVYGPPGMSADLTARLSRAVSDALRQSDVQEKILSLGLVPNYGGPEELAATQASHYKRWEGPIKTSGFTAE